MAEVKKLRCSAKHRNIGEIVGTIKANLSAEYVCEASMLGGKAVMLCFEEYYFRCNNYVSLSVMISENDDCQEVVIAGFGGGEGLFNLSYGANKSIVNKTVKCLTKIGFTEYL